MAASQVAKIVYNIKTVINIQKANRPEIVLIKTIHNINKYIRIDIFIIITMNIKNWQHQNDTTRKIVKMANTNR